MSERVGGDGLHDWAGGHQRIGQGVSEAEGGAVGLELRNDTTIAVVNIAYDDDIPRVGNGEQIVGWSVPGVLPLCAVRMDHRRQMASAVIGVVDSSADGVSELNDAILSIVLKTQSAPGCIGDTQKVGRVLRVRLEGQAIAEPVTDRTQRREMRAPAVACGANRMLSPLVHRTVAVPSAPVVMTAPWSVHVLALTSVPSAWRAKG